MEVSFTEDLFGNFAGYIALMGHVFGEASKSSLRYYFLGLGLCPCCIGEYSGHNRCCLDVSTIIFAVGGLTSNGDSQFSGQNRDVALMCLEPFSQLVV